MASLKWTVKDANGNTLEGTFNHIPQVNAETIQAIKAGMEAQGFEVQELSEVKVQ